MRNVIVSTYATLDGRTDDLPEWTIPYDDPAASAYHEDLLAGADGLLLGRRTYEIFAQIWPPRAGELPYIDRINTMAKYVVSTGDPDLSWPDSHLIADVKSLPAGNLVVYGGHGLTNSLREHDLIDEYRILVHPVLLGKGPAIAADGTGRTDLTLVDTAVLPGGVLVLTYRPAR